MTAPFLLRMLIHNYSIILVDRNQVSMGTDGYGELELDLLGSWRLRRDGVTVHVAARQQRLIAALAIRGPSLRSYLSGLLWPEYPDARALESLRVTVHLVSRQVPGLIVNAGALLSLNERLVVDMQGIRSRMQDLREDGPTGSAISLLRELRDAELLPGWYEDWVVFAQNRLTEERLRALTLMSRKCLAAGDPETAVEAAQAALEIEPLYERAVLVLIAAELECGNPGPALRTFERYREQLDKELGLLPSEYIKGLVAQALGRHTQSMTGGLVAAANSWLAVQAALNHT